MSPHDPCSATASDSSLGAAVEDNAGNSQCAPQLQVIDFLGWLQLITMHV
jgi:hypothetical protein